jgi:hypothetical protein
MSKELERVRLEPFKPQPTICSCDQGSSAKRLETCAPNSKCSGPKPKTTNGTTEPRLTL